MHTYKVIITRDDRWWMITVPELDGYVSAAGVVNLSATTQARRLSEVPGMAVDFICTVTDQPPSKVGIEAVITVDDIDVSIRAAKVAAAKVEVERQSAALASESRALARDLVAKGVAVRDVGEVLGVSFQRAQQLVSS